MENKFMILILQHSFEIVIYVVWRWLSEAGGMHCSKSMGSLGWLMAEDNIATQSGAYQ